MIFRWLFLTFLLVPVSFAQDNAFEVTSPAFANGGDIPNQYTCVGADVNPPLELKNIPDHTKSLVLTVFSPDAPEGVWSHWVVFNIKPNKTTIAQNSIPGIQALSDMGKFSYAGPCPASERQFHYIFRVYALSKVLPEDEGVTMQDLEKAMEKSTIAKTEISGSYRRTVW
jgi:Raf kinase inhibitor-like YbhB/YbcL family protein